MVNFWFVSLSSGPDDEDKNRTWDLLEQKTTSENKYSINERLQLPNLRVGTLDTLMALSDDLGKTAGQMEAIVAKLKRQVTDMAQADGEKVNLTVEGSSLEGYLFSFAWDEAKYPSNRPLKDTVEKIQDTVGKLEDDMKVKLGEYNQLKVLLSAAARKATGSLAVRDLSSVVKKEHIFTSDFMMTTFVVVPIFRLKEWETSYERLNDFVLPRSSRVIQQDNEYALASVIVFAKELDNFKAEARTKGFQVRDFQLDEEEQARSSEELEKSKAEAGTKRIHLMEWCQTAYGEAVSAWIHICVIRLFVESILRYGLPPSFVAGIVQPEEKKIKKLQQLLEATFGDASELVLRLLQMIAVAFPLDVGRMKWRPWASLWSASADVFLLLLMLCRLQMPGNQGSIMMLKHKVLGVVWCRTLKTLCLRTIQNQCQTTQQASCAA
ncbi:unnamed protein product [Ostreobium quekettii]|uniref:V-type proton ATPase subunit C n=1 Tax=Ostreobium quekettii TaxID=121088 RepID=A0A8S1IQW6_9CHLO|nr:unnamed protein product [Ostreobium quekettii]